MKFQLLRIKRKIESLLIFPFVLVGRLIAWFMPLEKEYNSFFFFPFYHTGGAEKIHAQIAKALGNEDSIIFFTRRSIDDRFLNDFKQSGCTIHDISPYTDNKWIYFINFIFRGIVSGYINAQKTKPFVFNGQSNFGYKISPWIKRKIKQADLVHSLNTFSYIRIPFIEFYERTVMISEKRLNDHINLYERYGISGEYRSRLVYIPNAADLPSLSGRQKSFEPFTVVFSGRNSPEKRAHIYFAIAKKVQQKDPSIQFQMIGMQANEAPNIRNVDFHGLLTDEKKIQDIYFKSSALVLTSSTEGFPLVVIEAMSHGCAIVATAVGDIPKHIVNHENGFLFSSVDDEELIINEGTQFILQLKNDAALVRKISNANIAYAQEHFSIERFNNDYQLLMNNLIA